MGIGEDDEDEGFDDSAYLLRAVARYFIHDDFKLEGEVAYIRGDNVIDDDDDGKGWEWGVMAQMRLFDLPVYGSLAYRAGDWDAPPRATKLRRVRHGRLTFLSARRA